MCYGIVPGDVCTLCHSDVQYVYFISLKVVYVFVCDFCTHSDESDSIHCVYHVYLI